MPIEKLKAFGGGRLLEATTVTAVLLVLAYASANYVVVLAAYAGYWSLRSPFKPMDERQYEPVVILSVSPTPGGVVVRLMRTYAQPGLLELAVTAKLFTREGGTVFLTARKRVPVGTIQEFVFQGGLHEFLECAEIIVVLDGIEVARWSGCAWG